MQDMQLRSLGWEDPLEEEVGKIPWWRSHITGRFFTT